MPRRPSPILLTLLVAFGPVSTDLYLASLPDMARAFATDAANVQLTLSAFLGAFAVAMPLHGPLSDRLGRRPVILGGAALYLVASVFCMVAPTITALIIGRFVQALGACTGPVVARAMVRDVYPRDQAAKVLSYMASAMALAPFAAPIAGGWLQAAFGWRANFAVLTLFGAGLLAAVIMRLDETNAHPDRTALDPLTMVANYARLLTDRRVLGYVLTVALAFAGMFTFISGSSLVLMEVLHVPARHFGFGFAGVIAGYILGGVLAGRLTARIGLDRMVLAGVSLCALAGLVMAGLAWSGIQTIPAIILPLSAYFFGAALVVPNATAGAIAPHPHMAGTASALVGFVQMSAGALAGWLVAVNFDGTTRPLALLVMALGVSALLAFSGLVMGQKA